MNEHTNSNNMRRIFFTTRNKQNEKAKNGKAREKMLQEVDKYKVHKLLWGEEI